MTKNACIEKQQNKHRGVSQSNPTSTKKNPEIHRHQFEHHNAQTTKKRAHFQNRKQTIQVDHSLLQKDLAQSDQISPEKIKPLKIQPFRQPYSNPYENLKQKLGLFGNKSNSGKSNSIQSKFSPRTTIKNLQRTPMREWASSRQGIRKSKKNAVGWSATRRFVLGSVNSLHEFNRELIHKGFRRHMPQIYDKNQYFEEMTSELEEDSSDGEDGEEEEYSESPQRDQSYSFNPFMVERGGRNRENNQEQDVVRYYLGEEELIYARILDYQFALLPPQHIPYYPQHAGFQRPLTDSNGFLPLDLTYIQQQQYLAQQSLLPHKFYENAFLYAHYGIHQASMQQENIQRNQFENQKLFSNIQEQKQALDPESSPGQQSKFFQSEQENQIISSVSKQQRFETTEMGTKQSQKDSFCPPSMNAESPFRPSIDPFTRNHQWINQTTTQKQTNQNRQFNSMSQETTTINVNSAERFNSIRPLNVDSEDKQKPLYFQGGEQTCYHEPIEINSTPEKPDKKNTIIKKSKRNSAKVKDNNLQALGSLSKFSGSKENIIQENDGMGQVMESEKKTAFKTEIVERTGSVSFNPFMTAPPSKDEIVNDEDSEMNEEPGGNANYPDHCTCQKNECSKGYCKCFYQGRGCDPLKCKCINCKNTNTNSEIVEKRNQLQQIKDNISAGCSCQKNKCKKKYCVCKLKGLKCGAKCRCVDCSNRGPNDPPCGEH